MDEYVMANPPRLHVVGVFGNPGDTFFGLKHVTLPLFKYVCKIRNTDLFEKLYSATLINRNCEKCCDYPHVIEAYCRRHIMKLSRHPVRYGGWRDYMNKYVRGVSDILDANPKFIEKYKGYMMDEPRYKIINEITNNIPLINNPAVLAFMLSENYIPIDYVEKVMRCCKKVHDDVAIEILRTQGKWFWVSILEILLKFRKNIITEISAELIEYMEKKLDKYEKKNYKMQVKEMSGKLALLRKYLETAARKK